MTNTQVTQNPLLPVPIADSPHAYFGGRILLLCGKELSAPGAIEQLRWKGLDFRVTSFGLVALGLIVDFDPEVLWIESTDNELSTNEILNALSIPRQIRPIAVVLSQKLNAELPDLDLSQVDEVLDLGTSGNNPEQLMQLIKVARLERLVIQRESEIFDSLPHALIEIDHRLIVWKVNRGFCELFDITDPDYRKKALGRTLGGALAAAGLPIQGNSPLPQLINELERCIRTAHGSFRVKEVIGDSERLLSGNIIPLVHSPEHLLIDLRDITADEQAVLTEARRERLATIGNLSVGVAHEIQNPNTFSRVNAANLKMMLDTIKPLITRAAQETGGKIGSFPVETFISKMAETITSVDMASRRIEAVLETLKTFGRQDDSQLGSIEIKPEVDRAVILVQHEARGKAEIEVNLPADLPLVTASPTGLSQVLVNLLQNAVHALSDDKPQARGDNSAQIRVCCDAVTEEEVIISVTDNGPGIPEKLQDKVLRPYFTTKPQGKGTGLGLSISCDMLQRFGGDLTLRSRPGEGTTFYIKLRRHDYAPTHS